MPRERCVSLPLRFMNSVSSYASIAPGTFLNRSKKVHYHRFTVLSAAHVLGLRLIRFYLFRHTKQKTKKQCLSPPPPVRKQSRIKSTFARPRCGATSRNLALPPTAPPPPPRTCSSTGLSLSRKSSRATPHKALASRLHLGPCCCTTQGGVYSEGWGGGGGSHGSHDIACATI